MSNTNIELSKENFYRMWNVLFPPDSDVLAGYCKQGFDDALRFLQNQSLTFSPRCLDVTSSYGIGINHRIKKLTLYFLDVNGQVALYEEHASNLCDVQQKDEVQGEIPSSVCH